MATIRLRPLRNGMPILVLLRSLRPCFWWQDGGWSRQAFSCFATFTSPCASVWLFGFPVGQRIQFVKLVQLIELILTRARYRTHRPSLMEQAELVALFDE